MTRTSAAVVARKYAFRKRVLMVMASTLVLSAATAFLLTSSAWWFFSVVSAVTVLYLGYLRRQTRIEERVQRRRMQRMARSQLGVENTTTANTTLSRRGCGVPAPWCWRSTTKTRSSSISTTRRTPREYSWTGACRERWGNRRFGDFGRDW